MLRVKRYKRKCILLHGDHGDLELGQYHVVKSFFLLMSYDFFNRHQVFLKVLFNDNSRSASCWPGFAKSEGLRLFSTVALLNGVFCWVERPWNSTSRERDAEH